MSKRKPVLCVEFDTEQEMVDWAVARGLKITGHATKSFNGGRSFWQSTDNTSARLDRNGAYAVSKLPVPTVVRQAMATVRPTELDAH